MRFTDIFIRRPVLSIVVSLLIFLIGLRAFMELPLRQFPRMTNTVITVTTSYPGATAELMQGFITTPIERAVSTIEGLDYMTSSSTQGTSTVVAAIKLNYDPGRAMTDVMAKVQEVKYKLPKDANDPVLTRTTGEIFGSIYLAFFGKTLTTPAINEYIDRVVTPLLSTVPGVAQVLTQGGRPFAMRIWLDPSRMAARDVTAEDVANAIRANNFQSAPGQTKGAMVVTSVMANTGLTSIDQFKDMVVKSSGGALVRLRDIAEVEMGAKDTSTGGLRDGQTAVYTSIFPSPDGNPILISEAARKLLPEIERSMPAGMKVSLAWDTSEFIKAAIHQVIGTLIETVLIVIFVIYLFLGSFRAVIIPVVTIPLSLVGVCVIMLALGFSLNLLTLLALVLAIGLVVDDAIVVVENVHRHIEEGQTPLQAALNGAREILGPVVAMAITLAAVYTPIGFLGGITGSLFREFAFTLAASVLISGVIALTLSPMMSSALLTHAMSDTPFVRFINTTFNRLTALYADRLSRVLNYRAAMGVFIVGVFAAVIFMFFNIASEMAPADDQGIVMALVRAPQAVNIDYTTDAIQQTDKILAAFPEAEDRMSFTGRTGPSDGITAIRLKPWDERKRTVQQLLPVVQHALSGLEGASAFAFTFPPLPSTSGGLPIQFVLSSPDSYKSLYQNMEQLKAAARASGLFQVTDSNLTYNNPMIQLKIDRSKANDLGISMQSIGTTLATLVGENYTNRFSLEGQSYEVITEVPRSLRLSPQALTQFYVRTASGQQIPLSTVVSIDTDVQPNALTRFNQLNASTFSALPAVGVSMGQAVNFLLKETAEKLPHNIHTAFLNSSRQFVQEGNELLITFAFAVIIIYLVLAAQYESLRDPLVILISVPMSVCGALLPMFFGLTTMNIYTQIGLVTLIGLISKHGILMVSFARAKQMAEGCDRRTAIEQAAQVRLRPILMTTAAMVAGLFPLLFSSGAGAESRFALGVVVVAGMTVGTLFTLFVLPVVYTVLATDHRVAAAAMRAEAAAQML